MERIGLFHIPSKTFVSWDYPNTKTEVPICRESNYWQVEGILSLISLGFCCHGRNILVVGSSSSSIMIFRDKSVELLSGRIFIAKKMMILLGLGLLRWNFYSQQVMFFLTLAVTRLWIAVCDTHRTTIIEPENSEMYRFIDFEPWKTNYRTVGIDFSEKIPRAHRHPPLVIRKGQN
jgi:hypothetical protein